MKKIFSTLVLLTAFSFCAYAGDADDTEDHDCSFIITDCGTMYEVPNNWTDEQIAAELDKRTIEDCMYGFNK